MSAKVKGRMYCLRCDMPVTATKPGHNVRNTAAVGGAVVTGGLSLFAAKSSKWCCPTCGGKCVPAYQAASARRQRIRSAERWGRIFNEGKDARAAKDAAKAHRA